MTRYICWGCGKKFEYYRRQYTDGNGTVFIHENSLLEHLENCEECAAKVRQIRDGDLDWVFAED